MLVIEFSRSQNTFHIDDFDEIVRINEKLYLSNSLVDYVIVQTFEDSEYDKAVAWIHANDKRK